MIYLAVHLVNSSLKGRKEFYLNQDVRGDRKRQGRFLFRPQKPKQSNHLFILRETIKHNICTVFFSWKSTQCTLPSLTGNQRITWKWHIVTVLVFIRNWISCPPPIIVVSRSPNLMTQPRICSLAVTVLLKSESLTSPPLPGRVLCIPCPWSSLDKGAQQSWRRGETTHSLQHIYICSHLDCAKSNIYLPSCSLTLRRKWFL